MTAAALLLLFLLIGYGGIAALGARAVVRQQRGGRGRTGVR